MRARAEFVNGKRAPAVQTQGDELDFPARRGPFGARNGLPDRRLDGAGAPRKHPDHAGDVHVEADVDRHRVAGQARRRHGPSADAGRPSALRPAGLLGDVVEAHRGAGKGLPHRLVRPRGYAPRGDEQIDLRCRRQNREHSLGVVRAAPSGDDVAPRLRREPGQKDPVRVGDAALGQFPARGDEFASRGEKSDPRTGPDEERPAARRRRRRNRGGGEHDARGKDGRARIEVFALEAHIGARSLGRSDRHRRGRLAHAGRMIRVFHLDDGVRAVGHRRPRHDPNRRPRLERAFARIPGCGVSADGQRGRNAGDVGVAYGEAVHRGVRERGNA